MQILLWNISFITWLVVTCKGKWVKANIQSTYLVIQHLYKASGKVHSNNVQVFYDVLTQSNI